MARSKTYHCECVMYPKGHAVLNAEAIAHSLELRSWKLKAGTCSASPDGTEKNTAALASEQSIQGCETKGASDTALGTDSGPAQSQTSLNMSLRKKLEKDNNVDDATGINILQPGRNVSPHFHPSHQHRTRILPWQREAPSPPDAYPVTHTTISAPAEKAYKLSEALEVEAHRLLEDLHNLPDINMAQASKIVGRQTFLEECAGKVASI
ncbi:uncharacterized protein ARMOST_20325 [Armillaria ostoyae]|uniref:Uncharacterized protein n=1 Tax=Armillaria ostoyae TaxID=47428 RepID=A0A284S752_ARMOS|nr:uncharacterized protein ARMOST_20325 [Armillaria ostoyae]